MLQACVADNPFERDDDPGDPNATIRVSANVKPTTSTRAYIEEGEINDSTYFLIYNKKSNSSTYGHAKVDFGHEEGPSTGYAYYMNGDTPKELKWLEVYGSGSSDGTFYLSNMDPDTYTTSSSTSLLYWRLNNPITAAPLDKTWGSNDIILGMKKARASGGRIDFELDHVLSLLKVTVEVYGANDKFFVDLDEAVVTISNLCRTAKTLYISNPGNFSYSSSTPSSGSASYYDNPGPIILSSPDENTPYWEMNPANGGETPEDQAAGRKVYATHQFVVPPQTIPPSPTPSVTPDGYTGGRPRLSITLPRSAVMGGDVQGEITYSGLIPEVMFELDEDGAMKPTPFNIELKSGYQLNIKATINSPNTELVFAPVTVEPWQRTDVFTITTNQVGIYNETHFRNMLQAYEDGDIDELSRYGYPDGQGNYVFQLWNDVKLEDWEIRGKMKEGKAKDLINGFCFLLNAYSFTLGTKGEDKDTDRMLSGSDGQMELYNIVTDSQDEQFIGVTTSEDFLEMLGSLTNPTGFPDIKNLSHYGIFNNSDNTFRLIFTESFTVPLEEIFQEIETLKVWGYDVSWDYADGITINVEITGDNGSIIMECPGDIEGYDKLYHLMVTNLGIVSTWKMGIRSAEDLYFLIDIYNNYVMYNENLLSLFGEIRNGSGYKWGFYHTSSTHVEGSKVFRSMVPDAAAGKPTFSFYWLGTMYIDDDYTPITVSGNALTSGTTFTKYVQGTGAATSNTSLSTIVSSYNNNSYTSLWNYGYIKDGIWTFNLTYSSSSQTVPYSTLFGMMNVNYDEGRYDYNFNLGTTTFSVTDMPVERDSETTKTFTFRQNGIDGSGYPSSAEALKKIAEGTYWDYYDEWLIENGN